MVNSILWTQGATSTEADVFVIDGIMNKEKESNNNQVAYNKLLEMSEVSALHPNLVKILNKQGIVQSHLFMATHKKDDGIFFKSNYKTVDEAGRNVAYMFYCKTNDINYAYEVFLKSSKMANRMAIETEQNALKLLFNFNKYCTVATVVTAGILIALLWKITN